ncbi:glycoside hydrolase domain-containing protein [Rathayibacter iranicus]|uniref:DUF1906 domain-containing protein n=2 Tax=Rathayibacter iranicus TaxID=59737 RepID=A0AAD1ADE3_9MICO|nr:glycoside hydrolase domain-containing protein [Rathayibacter iranicus]AZZ56391.1 DUF1906 domain-containing protein [Rathayibacter iranicus]MWV31763.1 DUF1906 domain-containing protein [Rathayibacter iranicus NCPPB 2253 = VKM Ac-1602]PPI44951.1 hypothetical protein C5E09_10190 [Rathayibacter iranicus]PPI59249.1 hypothetical protein C5E08_11125 [Rathayibacter iranicus]PPI70402.1 hypothetical protein C5E01_10165 [Rathayibacter iranicus]
MADKWILESQKWVNSTYKGAEGYSPVKESGDADQATRIALTRALQVELKLKRSDEFSDEMLSTLTSEYKVINDMTPNKNIIAIVQCALWCKGYYGGTTWKTFDAKTSSAIAKIRTEIGIDAGPDLMPKLVKSLLSSDTYVLASGGSSLMRQIQQDLNKRYLGRGTFFVVPCDGLYSPQFNKGLVYGIQYEAGLADDVANGYLGPKSRAALKDYAAGMKAGAVDSSKYFVHLLQASLLVNGYCTDGPYDGRFTSAMVEALTSFQKIVLLPETGVGDLSTWSSLLMSHGDPDRTAAQNAIAADCSVDHVTTARAKLLTDNGYQVIGRYLTNTEVADYNNKKIQPDELKIITDAGLRVFPIFQEGGDDASFFSYALGYAAGQKAHAAGRGYGLKAGVTIYFAVDFDATEKEVRGVIASHFQGVKDGLASVGSAYSVGIYGSRLACRIIIEKKLARLCFIADESYLWGGNFAQPFPSEWAFEQIDSYTIGSGADSMDLDKIIATGRDEGAKEFDAPQSFFDYADWLYLQAVAFLKAHPDAAPRCPNELTLQFLRAPRYTTWRWESLAGDVNKDFVSFVEAQKRERVYHTIGPEISTMMSADRMALALVGARRYELPANRSTSTVGDFLGWASDLTRTLVEYVNARNSGATSDAHAFGLAAIAHRGRNFDTDRYQGDVDGCVLGLLTKGKDVSVAAAMRSYYTASSDGYRTRFQQFLDARFEGNITAARDAAVHWLTTSDSEEADLRTAFLALDENKIVGPSTTTDAEMRGLAQAWADTLTAKIAGK